MVETGFKVVMTYAMFLVVYGFVGAFTVGKPINKRMLQAVPWLCLPIVVSVMTFILILVWSL